MPLWLDLLRTPMAAPETDELRAMRRTFQVLCVLCAVGVLAISPLTSLLGRAAGVGVALLPSSVLAVTVEGVRYLELDEQEPVTTDVALAWRRDDPQPALDRALAVLCRPDPSENRRA